MQQFGFDYSSDTRGTHPFIPTWHAEIIACPQLPTTLPTLDELMNRDGITLDNIAEHILKLTEAPSPSGHVYTLHAELEGGEMAADIRAIVAGLAGAGLRIGVDAAISGRIGCGYATPS